MSKENVSLYAFNRGIVSQLGLARIDLDRTRLSAEIQTNYIPRTLGSMMLRPGLGYIAGTKEDETAIHIPFVFATDDTAYLQFTDQNMRVYVDDTPITRTSVSTAVNNGMFDTDISGWTDADEGATASSSFATGGYMALLGTGFDKAIRHQSVNVAAEDQGVKHGLRVVVERGPVEILVGTSAGDDSYFKATLDTGVHSLAVTPTGVFFIQFQSALSYTVLVDSVCVEAGGIQDVPAPWVEADLRSMRWDQSADVIFVACNGYRQRRIERRGETSWSIVNYEPNDGPFRAINTSEISITPSALSGDITLTASSAFFTTTNVGSLIKVDSVGQTVELSATGADQWTDPIRVTGVDESRIFDIEVDIATGSFVGTVRIQKSVGEVGNWSDVSGLSYTGDASTTHDDELDNQIIFYRIGVKTGEYTSGTAAVSLSYSSGSNTGIARITGFTSETVVDAIVLDAFGGTDASLNWYESEWSERRGFPSAIALHESRLAHAGKGKVQLSVTDAYDVFDSNTEGDSGPISRTIGKGPIDGVNWLFSGNRLVLGTDSNEPSIRSSSFDEPLSPTAFNIKFPSSQGSANVPIVQIDQTGIFVQRGQTTVYRLVYSEGTSYDYTSGEVTTLVPEIGEPGIIRTAAQRQPDTRIHCVRSDGKVAVWLNDPAEDVSCWVLVETDGIVEDVFVMPTGTVEDRVYYLVKRTINGETKRYLERWALESECQGGTQSKQADSFITYSGDSTSTLSGLDHLEGESVVVWADGVYNGAYTVSSGSIIVDTAVESAVIGLTYTAQFKSTKLAYATEMGTALNQKKIVPNLGLVLYNTHKLGIKYGAELDDEFLDPLPDTEDGEEVADDTLWTDYDQEFFPFDGDWDTDSRVCLQSEAPFPVTVLACSMGIRTNEKI